MLFTISALFANLLGCEGEAVSADPRYLLDDIGWTITYYLPELVETIACSLAFARQQIRDGQMALTVADRAYRQAVLPWLDRDSLGQSDIRQSSAFEICLSIALDGAVITSGSVQRTIRIVKRHGLIGAFIRHYLQWRTYQPTTVLIHLNDRGGGKLVVGNTETTICDGRLTG